MEWDDFSSYCALGPHAPLAQANIDFWAPRRLALGRAPQDSSLAGFGSLLEFQKQAMLRRSGVLGFGRAGGRGAASGLGVQATIQVPTTSEGDSGVRGIEA